MARFQELNQHINEILLKLISSQNLCKYLEYETDKDTDPLTLPDLSLEKRSELMFTRIFPFPKIPSNITLESAAYITVHFDNFSKAGSIYYKNTSIVFNVICHLGQMRMPAQLRPFSIMHEIDTLFNDQSVIGIGKTQFDSVTPYIVNNDYITHVMKYKFVDFS